MSNSPYERLVANVNTRQLIRTGNVYGSDGEVINVEEFAGGGGSTGTNDHRQLINRESPSQHPISAITNLSTSLSDILQELAAVESSLTAIVHIQEDEIPTKDDLPTNLTEEDAGNLYIVIDTGFFYIWTGSAYRQVNGVTDLRNYYTKIQIDTRLAEKQNDTTLSQAGEVLVGGSTPGTFDIKPVDSVVTSKPITNTDHLVTASGIYDADQVILKQAINADEETLSFANKYTDDEIEALIIPDPFPEAPTDGKLYARQGSTQTWKVLPDPEPYAPGVPDVPNTGYVYARRNNEWLRMNIKENRYAVLDPILTDLELYAIPFTKMSGDGRTTIVMAQGMNTDHTIRYLLYYESIDGGDFSPAKILYSNYTQDYFGYDWPASNSIDISYDGKTQAMTSYEPLTQKVYRWIKRNDVWLDQEEWSIDQPSVHQPIIAVSYDGNYIASAWSYDTGSQRIGVSVMGPDNIAVLAELTPSIGPDWSLSEISLSATGSVISFVTTCTAPILKILYQSRDHGATFTTPIVLDTTDGSGIYSDMKYLDTFVGDAAGALMAFRISKMTPGSYASCSVDRITAGPTTMNSSRLTELYGPQYGDVTAARLFMNPIRTRYYTVVQTETGYCFVYGHFSGSGDDDGILLYCDILDVTWDTTTMGAYADIECTKLVLLPRDITDEKNNGPRVIVFEEDKMFEYRLPNSVRPPDDINKLAQWTNMHAAFASGISDDGSVISLFLTGNISNNLSEYFTQGALWRFVKYTPYGIEDAPRDNKNYVRSNGQWVVMPS